MVAKQASVLDKLSSKCLPNNVCRLNKHCLANIRSFAFKAQCLSVWPSHKHVLDERFLFVIRKKYFWIVSKTLTIKCVCQAMFVVVAKRTSMLDKQNSKCLSSSACTFGWSFMFRDDLFHFKQSPH